MSARMTKLLQLLKKIGSDVAHIKNEKINHYSNFNIYCQDESRFGLLTLAHKALTIKGVRPLCRYEHKFENTYLFGAFSPINGAHLVLELPHCNSHNFQIFLDHLSMQDPEEFKIVILDNGAFHNAKSLQIPNNIELLFLPPYSPELNPAEKVWWMIKREIKMKHFKSMEELQQAMTNAVNKICQKSIIKQLCAFNCYQNII